MGRDGEGRVNKGVIFTGWCAGDGREALAASPEPVAAFIDTMAASKAPAMVRRYVSSVATFHRAAGVANPYEAQAQGAPLNDILVAHMSAVRRWKLPVGVAAQLADRHPSTRLAWISQT
jgi:hypothetical protein